MFWRFLVVSTVFFLGLAAEGRKYPNIVNVTVQKTFVPIGFDDNDRVQIAVEGVFPDTCYKVGAAAAEVNEKRKTIRVWQTAYHYSGFCTSMVIPFTQVVNVGIVDSGHYSIYDGPSGKLLGALPVTGTSNEEPDDYLYAPVDDALVIVDAAGNKALTLLGVFSDRCSEFKDVQVHYYRDVIVVQPIVVRTTERCDPERNRFIKTVELDPTLRGVYLLHVRVMNGQAINKMVDASFIEAK